ncbi:MAG TPA: hypothetical protein VMU64_08875 [Acidimicrobiales bacterium]|nr:hypothetical protein [Acidimicrobiales bacterium]
MSPTGDADPDAVLAALGADLAAEVTAAVPKWVVRCVEERMADVGGPPGPVRAAAQAAAAAAAADVGPRLAALLAADVDAQRATPLQLVRGAVGYPADVLRAAGVAPVGRDRFAEERFPDDPYNLTPATLGSLDPALAEAAVRWGAAKALAHRRRHWNSEEFTERSP